MAPSALHQSVPGVESQLLWQLSPMSLEALWPAGLTPSPGMPALWVWAVEHSPDLVRPEVGAPQTDQASSSLSCVPPCHPPGGHLYGCPSSFVTMSWGTRAPQAYFYAPGG